MGLFSKIGRMLPGGKDRSAAMDGMWVRGDAVSAFPTFSTAQIVRNFNATVPDECSVVTGAEVKALYRENDWIYVERSDGKRGFIPDEHCRIKMPRSYDYTSATMHNYPRARIVRRNSKKLAEENTATLKREAEKRVTTPIEKPQLLRRADTFHAGDRLDQSNLERFLQSLPVDKKDGDVFVKAPQGCARVRYSFENRNAEEVTVSKGEEAVILNTSDPDWTYVRNVAGEEGFVPSHCLKGFPPITPERPGLDLLVLEPYKASCGLYMSTVQGEWIKAAYPEIDGWVWAERDNGSKGFVPAASCIVATNI